MSKIAIVTDSNSGITQAKAKELGISVLPMPFMINGETYFEDINLTQEEFYKMLEDGAEISTSQPAVGDVLDLWDKLLEVNYNVNKSAFNNDNFFNRCAVNNFSNNFIFKSNFFNFFIAESAISIKQTNLSERPSYKFLKLSK